MYCKKCGNELKPNAKFCTICGEKVLQQQGADTPKQVVNTPNVEPKSKSESITEQTPTSISNPKQIKDRKKGILIAIICICVLAVGATATAIAYTKLQGKPEEVSTDELVKESEEAGASKEETKEVAEAGEAGEMVEAEEARTTEATPDAESETKEGVSQPETPPETPSAETAKEEADEKTPAPVTGADTSPKEDTAIHTYQLIMSDVTWTEAYQLSKNISNGYLVHINSEEEMDMLLMLITDEGFDDGVFWIGGARRGTGTDYHWIDREGVSVGEALNSNKYWLEGEPSFYDDSVGQEERYMNMFYLKSVGDWVWNDVPNDIVTILPTYSGRIGYIVEIDDE